MLSFEEGRVLGAMVEKAQTTPDNYPMSLNAVVTACNQVSNRHPIVSFEEGEVELILRALADRGLSKMVHRPGDRVVKYRHALDAELGVAAREISLIAVLLLRGAQTPGELRQRTQRYVEFASLPEVEMTLEALRHREVPLVARLDRMPGQKEHRYRHLLVAGDGRDDGDDGVPQAIPTPEVTVPNAGPGEAARSLHEEVADLRAEVADLRRRIDRVTEELGID